ncbi:hypothetical protein CYMTET_51381 [Cymbomonas tetramitiformis]|uniref:CTLH domain-containing protein n=1 Tax=Cymbomonas tetramitiformis TaxID=36881 RepID=A0AAE0BME1_9CHLO|nr:hypothetical protein CYMTET_51381 [Cymbomonas tetramitiformis]
MSLSKDLSKELVFLILQFLEEEGFKKSLHALEQESGHFFNLKYFEELILLGNWEEVEKYLLGFTRVEYNRYSMKMFFEIRKQKFLEALDSGDRNLAVCILTTDLKVFRANNEELYKEMATLLTLEDFRENDKLSNYGDAIACRQLILADLRKLIEANPHFRDKLQVPNMKRSRMRTLINQSLNWQHQFCKNPYPSPEIKTLFVDHNCGLQKPAAGGAPGVAANQPHPSFGPSTSGPILHLNALFQSAAVQAAQHQAAHGGLTAPEMLSEPVTGLGQGLKRPRSGNPSMTEVEAAQVGLKRGRAGAENLLGGVSLGASDAAGASKAELPDTLVRTIQQSSTVTAFDFHPVSPSLLLVGTQDSTFSLWDVLQGRQIFKEGGGVNGQGRPQRAGAISRLKWGFGGGFFGVAYSRRMIQSYYIHQQEGVHLHNEINAHDGAVNDLAFVNHSSTVHLVTCGDDGFVKVWDLKAGAVLQTFRGHEGPVYSVCPFEKDNLKHIFSTGKDGKVKAWIYDDREARVSYVAPGRWATHMVYSKDGRRLFSCGTGRENQPTLVEWNEIEGKLIRQYMGFHNTSEALVRMDVTADGYLAVGDEGYVKFWSMDQVAPVLVRDCEGTLPESPNVCFNSDCSLLVVTGKNNSVNILARAGLAYLFHNQVPASSFHAATEQLQEHAPGLIQQVAASAQALYHPHKPLDTAATAGLAGLGSAADASSKLGLSTNMSSPAAVLPSSTSVAGKASDKIDLEDPKSADSSVPSSRDEKPIETRTLSSTLEPGSLLVRRQCRVQTLTHHSQLTVESNVVRLLFTGSGNGLLGLCLNGVHKLWKWTLPRTVEGGRKASEERLWRPTTGASMQNAAEGDPVERQEYGASMALSKNDSYVMSASGGPVSLFNMRSFKAITILVKPPPRATFFAFHPVDNNIVAVGMANAAVHIYNVRTDHQSKHILNAHKRAITGVLFFPTAPNFLVSAGSDGQLVMWDSESYVQRCRYQLRSAKSEALTGLPVRIHLSPDHQKLLAIHPTQMSLHLPHNLQPERVWTCPGLDTVVCGCFTCNGESILAVLSDNSILSFNAKTLSLQHVLSVNTATSQVLQIASHPKESDLFAISCGDSSVKVVNILPSSSDGKSTETKGAE